MRKFYICALSLLFSCFLTAQNAPDFNIISADNQVHALYADYLNQGKTVVIKIFFTTCPPCNSIAPSTEVLYQDWGGGDLDVEFFSLSNQSFDDNVDVAGYENQHNLTYPGAGQDGGSLTAVSPYTSGQFGTFYGTPTFVVIAPDGNVQFDVAGGSNAATIAALDAAIEVTGASRPTQQVFHSLVGQISNSRSQGVALATLDIGNGIDPVISGSGTGAYSFSAVPASSTLILKPEKNIEADNGITTFDIVLIVRHILEIEALDSPYKMIAADVNKSNTITTFDVLQLRKLILGIDTAYTTNTSWRFVPENYTFPDPSDPFIETFPEQIDIASLDEDYNDLDFIGIKIGDASASADPSQWAASDQRNETTLPIEVLDQDIKAGQDYIIDLRSRDFEEIIAMQFSLHFDTKALQLLDKDKNQWESQLDIKANNFGFQSLDQGWITFAWNDIYGKHLDDESLLLRLRFRALQDGQVSDFLTLSSDITPSLSYTPNGEERPLDLVFVAPVKQQDVTSMADFQLQPNPASDQIQLSYLMPEAGFLKIELFNAQQQVLHQYAAAATAKGSFQYSLPIDQLQDGVYFLRLSDVQQKKVMVKKFVRLGATD